MALSYFVVLLQIFLRLGKKKSRIRKWSDHLLSILCPTELDFETCPYQINSESRDDRRIASVSESGSKLIASSPFTPSSQLNSK